jgi:hypothetical protein
MRSGITSFLFAILFAAVSGNSEVIAQISGSQQLVVSVQEIVSITAPASASIDHDLTGNPQVFSPQDWLVRGNTARGVTVTFQTNGPFVNTANRNFRRDARLGLAFAGASGPAAWNVTIPADQSNFNTGKNTATVSARSNNPGSATMKLTVTFITGDASSLLAGNYVTTVTGTIAANP